MNNELIITIGVMCGIGSFIMCLVLANELMKIKTKLRR